MSLPNRAAVIQDDGRVDFRALLEANWQRVAARIEPPESEAGPSTADDDVDPAVWEKEKERRKARREKALADARARSEEAEAKFLQTKEKFEQEYGGIVDYYFARTVEDAGAALTVRARLTRFRSTEWIQLHFHNLDFFDLPDEPAFVSIRAGFAELLHLIDAKHTSASFMLRGLSRHVCLLRLFALRREMLADLDKGREALGYGSLGLSADAPDRADENAPDPREQAVEARLARSLSSHKHEFESISRTYSQAATREARIIYLNGMLVGLMLLGLFSVVVGLGLWVAGLPFELATFFTCLAAGAVGAFVSVLQRMSTGKFSVNHEVGREYVQRLAYFRPFIGSIFGLAVFFALVGGIANVTPPNDAAERYAFFAFTAFLAGFSERFTAEILGRPSGADTENAEQADLSELGSAAKRLTKLDAADGGADVVVETTRVISRSAPSETGND